MGPFISHLSDLTAPLRTLIKKDAEYEWLPTHQSAFVGIKDAICEEVTLNYFDPQVDTVLRVDASMKGIGAVLLQKNKPVAFASKSLSETEQRYANIEREMLAVVFGCKRFHTYLYGKTFILESDHKPLEMIHLKNISAAPQRLQRMLLQIQPYDLIIKYRPGKEMTVADAISRSPSAENGTIELDIRVDFVQFSEGKLQSIKHYTQQDSELQALKETIIEGWPDTRKELPSPTRQYWVYRDELSIEDGIILKGERILIPAAMRSGILQTLHAAHQGIENTKLRAKTAVFWPGINADIEETAKNCHICQEFQVTQPREPLLQHDLPTRPWQILGSDLFYMDGDEFLILCDYYSKFPIIRKVKDTRGSRGVVELLTNIFSEYGIPDEIISDNGPHYASGTFKSFSEEWGFKHTTSSPHYPQSNGFIERQIQTVKRTLAKAAATNSNPDMAMLILRSTPINHQLPSPAELLNSRKLKSNLPTKIEFRSHNRDNVRFLLEQRQSQQKYYYDQKTSTTRAPLIADQQIRTQDITTGKWKPAVIVRSCPEPRSYIIETSDGKILRRTSQHLKEVPEKQNANTIQPRRVHFDVNPPTVHPIQSTPVHPVVSEGVYTRSGRVVRPPRHLTADYEQ